MLWLAGLRYLRRHPWQLALAVFGIALGVAVVVAIDLANQSATRAFALSTEALAGSATHRVVGGPDGVPVEVYRRLVVDGGVTAAPILERRVTVRAGEREERLRLLGIDPFAEAPFRGYLGQEDGAVPLGRFVTEPFQGVLSAETAAALGIVPGDSFEIATGEGRHALGLLAILDPPEARERRAVREILLVDIATAAELLHRPDHVSHIDLLLEDDEEARRRVETLLPPGTALLEVGDQTSNTAAMTDAFRLNLTALSLLALVCGTFLVYNTVSFSVVQRRPLLGRLRALGVTRRQLFAVILGEAAALGAVGAILGVTLGILLGSGLVHLVTRTINDLYFTLEVRQLALPPATLAKGLALGLFAAVGAALAPAREATTAPPRAVLSRSGLESAHRRAAPRFALLGAALLALATLLMLPREPLALSFFALLVGLLGCTLLIPQATVVLARLLRGPAELAFGVLGRMAARGIEASLSRTAVAIAALTLAVAVTSGVGTMVASFRHTVAHWLEAVLPADIYLSPSRINHSTREALLERPTVDAVAALPGIEGVGTVRVLRLETPEGFTRVVAVEFAAGRTTPGERGFVLRETVDGVADAWQRFDRGAALISEPYAFRHRAEVGSSISLRTASGEHPIAVAGIYTDYGSDRGAILLHRRTYDRLWPGDTAVTGIAAFAEPGAEVTPLVERLRTLVGPERVEVRSNRELRRLSLEIFDRTFQITSVLHLLAGAVAFLGVLGALMALQLERARELGVLRANGLTPRQLWRLVTTQTGLLGLVAGLLSIPLGIALAAVMIHIINRRSFGWTLDMVGGSDLLLQILPGVGVAILAAVLAGLYPAWKMAHTSPAEALRGE
jgi:putative ABC transport system permease protein